MCARLCAYAPRRRYVTSSHGNQCSWPPTRSHGAKPTRLASFGHLCASAPLTCLSLFLFFLIFLPLLLLRATLSRVRFSSCEPLGFLFLLFFRRPFFPPAPLYLPAFCSMKIMPCTRERYFNTFGNRYGILQDAALQHTRRREESLQM